MIRFEHPAMLWALALLPVLLGVFLLYRRWRRKALKDFGDDPLVKRIMPDVAFSRPGWKFSLYLLAVAALIMGLANPQIGTVTEEGERKGADLMILLDVSNSMMAGDLPPNRLENAKRGISRLIDQLRSDRIGIIVFAGESYVQLPITSDYTAAKLFLNHISTDMVPTQGTAIGTAIDMAMKTFDQVSGTSKAMIVMTDGENHEDDAVAAAQRAQREGVVVHVVGLGSPEGAPVPIFQGGNPVGFIKDENGQTVVSKLNESMCQEIAAAAGGMYVRASTGGSGLDVIMEQVDKMEKKAVDIRLFKSYEDRFQLFLGFALLLLLVEFFISNRKSRKLGALNLFEVKKK